MVFSPNKNTCTCCRKWEAPSTFTSLTAEAQRGATIAMLPTGFKGTNGAAAIHMTPDGHFLYAHDRLDASAINCYSVNPETGS